MVRSRLRPVTDPVGRSGGPRLSEEGLPHTVTQARCRSGHRHHGAHRAGSAHDQDPLVGVIKAFFGWLTEEGVLTVSPIAKAWVWARSGVRRRSGHRGPGLPVRRPALGPVGHRPGPPGLRVACRARGSSLGGGGNDGRRRRPPCRSGLWVRQPVVEVEGRLVRNQTPKGGRSRAVVVGPQFAQLLREHLMLHDGRRGG